MWQGEIKEIQLGNIRLFYEKGRWWLTSEDKRLPADGEKVESLINRLITIKLDDVVSVNKDNWQVYGLKEGHITVSIGGKALLVGNINGDFSGTYARAAEGDNVYQVGVVLDKQSLQDANYWKQKLVTNIARYQLSEIRAKLGDKEINLTADEGKWTNEEVADKACYLEAVDYLGESGDAFEDKATISLKGEGIDVKLILGQAGEGKDVRYYATTDGVTRFIISKDDYDLLTGWIK